MLFITNRAINENVKSEIGRTVSLDIDNNNAGQSVYFCKREHPEFYKELGSKVFFSELKTSRAKQILIYIHGYSNLPEENIFPRAMQLQKLFDEREKDLVQVVPLIWPCDNDVTVLEDYWDDQKAADASAFAFARVLEKFKIWQINQQNDGSDYCSKRINVLAHSMGNRVLREALRAWAKYEGEHKIPQLFRNSFLVAADVVNESLEKGQAGYFISQASRNVSVYYAGDDLALRASKVINQKNGIASKRLGHSGPDDIAKVSKNIYAIDCDEVNTEYDSLAGHSYFLTDKSKQNPGVVFNHILNSIKTGRVLVDSRDGRSIILDADTTFA